MAVAALTRIVTSSRKNHAALFLFAMAAMAHAGVLQPPAAPTTGTMRPLNEIEPRTPVQSLAGSPVACRVIDRAGSYYLTGPLTVTELKHGISIEASDVSLDLSGFAITGAFESIDSSSNPAYAGIHILPGARNVAISNGIIEGSRKKRFQGFPPVAFFTKPFSSGIDADWDITISPRLFCEGLQVKNVIIRGCTGYGIYLKGRGHLISGCTSVNNEGPGIHAGFPSTVRDNHQSSNGDNLLLVAANGFVYQNTDWAHLPSYYIARYETTNAEYCDFLNEADQAGQYYHSSMEITRTGTAGDYTCAVQSGRHSYPIRYTCMYDAHAYAEWKSSVTGFKYRLPTPQEWEKAAGWDPTIGKLFNYGFHRDAIDATWCNYAGHYGSPLPVGSFNGTAGKNDAKSHYGCYDMSGNVLEWTPSLPLSDFQQSQARGGTWYNAAGACTVTSIVEFTHASRYGYLGVRLCRDPE